VHRLAGYCTIEAS